MNRKALKPIALHTGNELTIKEKQERAEREEYYRLGRLQLVPPDELSERAKIKFNQIVAEAFWLDELSVDLLAAYCHAWDKWLECVEEMKGKKEIYMDSDAKIKQNPYRNALTTYTNVMAKMSERLGLGNIDRLRLTVQKPEEKKEEKKVEMEVQKNPFEEFMAKVK